MEKTGHIVDKIGGGGSSNRKDSEDRRGCPVASQHADALCCASASDGEAVRHGGTRTLNRRKVVKSKEK